MMFKMMYTHKLFVKVVYTYSARNLEFIKNVNADFHNVFHNSCKINTGTMTSKNFLAVHLHGPNEYQTQAKIRKIQAIAKTQL